MEKTRTPLEVLVVDDEPPVRDAVGRMLGHFGHRARTAADAEEALRLLEEKLPDVVVTDIVMPGMNGLELLAELRTRHPRVEVIVMTGLGDVETAVRAMKTGAFDYVTKPFPPERLANSLDSAALSRQTLPGRERSEGRQGIEVGDGSIFVGCSDEMQGVFDLIESVRANRATVLIHGDTGTGKECAARAIHFGGVTRDLPFVAVNCGAIPKDLLESQLFGHVKGAFTGAHADYQGFFRAAGDGTIFLDEISEVPLGLQSKLLRALQERVVVPVGDTRPTAVGARVITAMNTDPEQALTDGKLREDLFYRISVVKLALPPLRRRRRDVPILAEHFISKHAGVYNASPKRLSRQAMLRLMEHEWPGNVRELENVIERLYALDVASDVTPEEVIAGFGRAPSTSGPAEDDGPASVPTLEEAERKLIADALRAAGGNKKRAAEMLDIPRQRLYRRIKLLGIEENGG